MIQNLQLNIFFFQECTDFAAKRTSCFQANNLKELFKGVPVGSILSFLKQVNLFYKICFNHQSYFFIYRFFTTTFISYLVVVFNTSSIYLNDLTLLDANDPSGLMRR